MCVRESEHVCVCFSLSHTHTHSLALSLALAHTLSRARSLSLYVCKTISPALLPSATIVVPLTTNAEEFKLIWSARYSRSDSVRQQKMWLGRKRRSKMHELCKNGVLKLLQV